VNAREKIQEEKLRNILNPRKAAREFKITVRFQQNPSPDFAKALERARHNRYFLEEGEGDFYRVYASFYPQDADELYRLFELVKDHETTTLFLNNKRIPYIYDLWLSLMWFYRGK
jgi:hypothetical protein